MVRRELFLFPILFLLWGCPAGLPTGPDTDISRQLTANCLISPYEDTLKIFISNWNETSEYDDDFSYDLVKNPFGDYWSVAGATVSIAVNGKSLSVEENTVTDWMEYNKNNYTSFYQFANVDIHPGQHWELTVTHPDYDSLYAETVIPDSVIFVELPRDTIKNSDGMLLFKWNKARWTEGYLPLLTLVTEGVDGKIRRQEMYIDWDSDERSGTNTYPQKVTSIQYSVKNLLEQVKFFTGLNQYKNFYLQLRVYSLNDALYNIQRWDIRPDEISGFNAPIQIFSNVVGGSGILGAFWRTKSPEIVIGKDLILSLFENP